MLEKRVESVWWTLRIVFGVVPIVAGLDKFVGLIADWGAYLSPLARQVIPLDPSTFMRLVGVVEVAAGILVLARPRIGARVVALWLLAISVDLVAGGHLDIAVRDLVMAVSAWCLGRLSDAREQVRVPERERAPASTAPAAAARA